MHRKYYILYLLLVCAFTACVPCSVREAQSVVAQADRLWQAGQMYGDSSQLAQAYGTLGQWQWFYADEYAHACYHYGKLLRAKDNPVAAMQAFINATHSHTRDYAILGRIYNNIGDICHLAGEFPLSYDMFERSAEMYLQSNDTTAYYYVLNDMAYELAEQEKKDSCFAIVENIKSYYLTDSALIAYCLMSQAQAFLKCKQYDSVLFYAGQSKRYLQSVPSVTLQLAQAYSLLGVKDSAALYAEQVLMNSHALSDINNALYILANDDRTKDIEAVRQTGAERSDTQKLLEIRQGKMSQAVQMLQQDLNKKADWRWLYAIIATILVIGTVLGGYVTNRWKKNKLLKQEFDSLNQATEEIQEKHNALSAQYNINHKHIEEEIANNCMLLRNNEKMLEELAGTNYNEVYKIIDRNFYMLTSKLRNKKILTEPEICLCILVLLDFNRNQIAHILHYAQSGIGKFKYRVSQKLGTDSRNLRDFLISMAIDGTLK